MSSDGSGTQTPGAAALRRIRSLSGFQVDIWRSTRSTVPASAASSAAMSVSGGA